MPVLASYARTGGRPPADDERLEVARDGSWRLWRTMGGARVGGFAGRLSADRRRRLSAAIEGAAEAGRPATRTRPRPDGAHEAFRAGSRSLDVAAGERVAGGWGRLASLLRRWSDGLASAGDAESALELELRPTGPVLVRHGSSELRLWPATLHLDLYARDADGIVVDRASAGPGPVADVARGEPITTGTGWTLPLAAPEAVEAPRGGTLEAWVWVDIEGADGPVRARLVATRPASRA